MATAIAVDVNDVEKCYATAVGAPAEKSGEGTQRTVKYLLDRGYNVILVSEQDMDVEEHGKKVHQCHADQWWELFKVSSDYRCPFLHNSDLDEDAMWVVPVKIRSWVRENRRLQVRFKFHQDGSLLLEDDRLLPDSSSQFGVGSCKADRLQTGSYNSEEWRATRKEVAGAHLRTDSFCETMELDTVATGEVISVQRGRRIEELLVVHWNSSEIFSQAKNLSVRFLGDKIIETHPGKRDEQLLAAVAEISQNWGHMCFKLATVTGGKFTGLRAVGAGSTKKKRDRASHLALAATALVHRLDAEVGDAEPPDGEAWDVPTQLLDIARKARMDLLALQQR